MLKNTGRLFLGLAGVTTQIIGLLILSRVHRKNVCILEKKAKNRKK